MLKGRHGADQPYQECQLGVQYATGPAPRPVSGPRGVPQGAGRRMRRAGGRITLTAAAAKVAVVEGAAWMRTQLRRPHVPVAALGLDFSPLAANVPKARRGVGGAAAAEGPPGAGAMLHGVTPDGYAAFGQRLVAGRGTVRSPRQRQAAAPLLT